MAASFALWVSAVAASVLLFGRKTRNTAYFALAGTALGLLYHYDIGTVPELRDYAVLLWAAAAFLLAAKTLAGRSRRTA